MLKELQLVNTLTFESEKIFDQALPKLRSSLPNYEVCAWDNNLSTTISPFDSIISKRKNYSTDLTRKASLSPIFTLDHFSKRPKIGLKKSPTPLMYKIATIALNDFESLPKEKKLKRMSNRYKHIESNKKFGSVYMPRKGATNKTEFKRNSVPEISNLLKMLKPETKNPVKAAIVPKLRSRTELYKSYTRKKERKKMNFSFLENMSPEPVKINLKSFK